MTDLGTLPGDVESFAHSINGSGQVVGESEPSTGYSRAFLFSNGTMTDLGTLGTPFNYGSDATSINASGQVVGESGTSSGGSDAFLYSNGTMTDLNSLISPTSGWDLLWASGINDSGQICGYGSNPAGLTDAFLDAGPRTLHHHALARLCRLPVGLRLAAATTGTASCVCRSDVAGAHCRQRTSPRRLQHGQRRGEPLLRPWRPRQRGRPGHRVALRLGRLYV